MSSERQTKIWSGWPMLTVTIALYILVPVLFILSNTEATKNAAGNSHPVMWMIWAGIGCLVLASLLARGFFTLQPNEARVLILFGRYKGTTRQVGFRWGNPFYSGGSASTVRERLGLNRGDTGGTQSARRLPRYKISLRARTLNGDKLKVNDRAGNPIDIAAVVVWHVQDTAQAIFDVDDFEAYVGMQSETSLRHLATSYAYDHGEGEETTITLRGNVDEVSAALKKELGERLAKAGVAVDEARLTHLAYAPEIAQAMLRRQQAEAIIAARQKIVQGAVGMVDQALQMLSERKVVELDEERKAAMVSNLMVVLCGESQVNPIVNTGTLYQ
ncbi:MAG TPA: SPFH domain-containing protein [Gaiellaceae bacterium]|jgi:regulator of protease activity HflC (stomatin/prohibitin superfamily)